MFSVGPVEPRVSEELKRYITSASFRHSVKDFKEHGTRFCHKCGFRTGGLAMYCSDCKLNLCGGCDYNIGRCHCKQVLEELHVMAKENSIKLNNYFALLEFYRQKGLITRAEIEKIWEEKNNDKEDLQRRS